MVGYYKNESLTPQAKFAAGIISGFATRIVAQPLDVIKLRMQLIKLKKNRNIISTALKILREEGPTAFFQGHIVGQLHSVICVSSQFYFYELSTAVVLTRIDETHASTLGNPLEVIRVRQMIIKDQYGGLINAAKAVYRYGGITAFYEGVIANCLQMGPQMGITFAVFSYLQPLLLNYLADCYSDSCNSTTSNRHSAQHLLVASSIAGCASGLIGKTLTYPLDLAKRRLQVGSHKMDRKYNVPSTSRHLIRCKSLTKCLKVTFEKEGLYGLYRGWFVTVTKAQLTNIMAFTTYELACFALREVT
ncbi:mitochondrial thiamine pyrophosphate carrier-like [Hyposmocoma kahamanoa]|uniref:mitochondrial thiamine pyrophosphate carrier-like n=1 Tax=Hyposmocoma kahamanoa TaxID=1477025 RepID=UPI000E6D795A|nr:mitochondrial thiamine pyrophosphate carrier-like [Hyposmocoma kahamanoa]